MSISELLVVLGLFALVYFLPSLVALGRRNPDINSVFLINLWLGWTIIGWITAIGWALDRRRQSVATVPARSSLRLTAIRMLSLRLY